MQSIIFGDFGERAHEGVVHPENFLKLVMVYVGFMPYLLVQVFRMVLVKACQKILSVDKLKSCLSPVFSSAKANQKVNEDGEFMLGSKELLEHIIEVYRMFKYKRITGRRN